MKCIFVPYKKGKNIMNLISTNIVSFETKVGKVDIVNIEGGWVFEFTSGWNNGLHCDVPFKTFDKCYTHIKGRMKEWLKESELESNYMKQYDNKVHFGIHKGH